MLPIGGNSSQQGYTLLELIVALSIISLMALAIPGLAKGILPGYKLKSATAQIETDLSEQKQISATTGTPSGLKAGAAPDTYVLVADGAEKNLDGGFEITLSPHPDFANTASPDLSAILFYPDGQSTGGKVEIKYQGRETALIVDWLTGAIREAGNE